MKKVSLVLAGIFLLSTMISADVISIRADSWEPHNGEPGAAKPGYIIEIVSKIFKDAGHSIDYQIMPWNRALTSVHDGKFNAVVGTDQKESPDFIFPTEAQGVFQMGFFVSADNSWKYNGLSSLNGKTLGVINEYSYGVEIDKYIKKGVYIYLMNGLYIGYFSAVGEWCTLMGSVVSRWWVPLEQLFSPKMTITAVGRMTRGILFVICI